MTDAKLTVLVENCAGQRGILGEHGLALWVEIGSTRILFDTGQGRALPANAEKLKVDLGSADALVLSHGHYDHTGGLASANGRFSNAHLFVNPTAFQPRYAGSPGGVARSVGSPVPGLDEARALVRETTLTREPTEVADGVWVTGEIPRRTEFEDTGGSFFLDSALTVSDPILDDQALVVETGNGLSVLFGCGHAGLVNTLDRVAELRPGQRIRLVLGGLHLVNASEERIARSLRALRRHGVERVAPVHCTGLSATASLLHEYGSGFVEIRAGTRLRLG